VVVWWRPDAAAEAALLALVPPFMRGVLAILLSSLVEDLVEEGAAVLGRCLVNFVPLLGGRGGGEGVVFFDSVMGD